MHHYQNLKFFSAKLTEVGDWIDEEVTQETEVSILEAKLKELTDLTSPLAARVKEHTDRPEALDALFKMINSSDYFLAKAKNRLISFSSQLLAVLYGKNSCDLSA